MIINNKDYVGVLQYNSCWSFHLRLMEEILHHVVWRINHFFIGFHRQQVVIAGFLPTVWPPETVDDPSSASRLRVGFSECFPSSGRTGSCHEKTWALALALAPFRNWHPVNNGSEPHRATRKDVSFGAWLAGWWLIYYWKCIYPRNLVPIEKSWHSKPSTLSTS